MKVNVYTMSEIALLAAILSIAGFFKIPLGIPGAEFQLSAPISVAIAAVFGFWRYLTAGVIASLILLFIGFHNLLNFEVSMVFRATVGILIALFGRSFIVLALAGPIGTTAARWVLALTLHLPFSLLLLQSLPGMIYTAIIVYPLYRMLTKVKKLRGDLFVRRNI